MGRQGGWLLAAAFSLAACADVGGTDEPADGGASADSAPIDLDEDNADDDDPDPPVIGGGGCGDYVCDADEDCDSCSSDCFCSGVGGNDVCDVGESASTTPTDCGERVGDALIASESDDSRLMVFWSASTGATGNAAVRENLLGGCGKNPDTWCFRRFFSRLKNDYAYLPDIVVIRDIGRDDTRAPVVGELKRQLDLLADGDDATQEYATRSGDGGLIAWRLERFALAGDVLRLTERVETAGAIDCGEVRRDGAGDAMDDAILAVRLEDHVNGDRRLAVSTMALATPGTGGGCQAANVGRVLYQARAAWGTDAYPELMIVSAETNQKADPHDDCDDGACVESWRQELDTACDPDDLVEQSGWYQRLSPLLTIAAGCPARTSSLWDPVALVQRSLELAGPGGTRPAENVCAHFTMRTLADVGEDHYACTSERGRIDHTLVRLERDDDTRIDDPREAREHIRNAKSDEGSYPAGSADPADHYASRRAQMIWLRW